MQDILFVILAVLAAAAIASILAIASRRRRQALEAVAVRLGLRFDPRSDPSVHRRFAHSVFDRGRSRKAYNNILGVLNVAGHAVRVHMADYRYVTGHGKQRRTHRLGFAAFELPFVGTPDLLIRREHLGDKLLAGLGFDDIDFESEEFSRRFLVKSQDQRYAYDVIHPGMMEFLLSEPTPQVEVVRDVCLVLEGRGTWHPETFAKAPAWFEAFLERWPEHVVDRLSPRGAGSS